MKFFSPDYGVDNEHDNPFFTSPMLIRRSMELNSPAADETDKELIKK
jgi:hypothetical protein